MDQLWPFLTAAILCCIFSRQIGQAAQRSPTVKRILTGLCAILVLIIVILLLNILSTGF